MNKYQKSKIYKIVCNITNEVYIGSTITKLNRRLYKHTSPTNNCISKNIISRGNYDIELIENYPCENKEQLHIREKHFITTMDCINIRIPAQTGNEIKENRLKYSKEYREKHKDTIKQYREKNKDTIKQYQEQYRDIHKEKQKQYNKQYQEKNKDKLNELIECECGSTIKRKSKYIHLKSRFHIYIMNNKNQK